MRATRAADARAPELEANTATQLREGCSGLGLEVDGAREAQLLDYLALLAKWNRTYNLTAVREPSQMVTRHLLDSLAIAPLLQGQRVLDVGTGAGLPGVPLAICYPERQFHLLDSNGKKTRFLFQVKTALCLDNMVVHQARVESFAAEAPFDTILSRAFASLQDMVRDCRHLLAPEGRFLAMKGTILPQELSDLRAQRLPEEAVAAVHPLTVPGLDEQRHLVEIILRREANQQQ